MDDYYSCDECGKIFVTEVKLKNHKKVHIILSREVCEKCLLLKSSSEHNPTLHDKPHHCELCGKGFNRKNLLEVHKTHHKKNKPYTCQQCFRIFTTKDALIRHIFKHDNLPGKFQCADCHKVFKRKVGLENHICSKTPSCEKCQRTYKNNVLFGKHCCDDETDKGTIVIRSSYPCDKCSSVFSKEISLKLHNTRMHLLNR